MNIAIDITPLENDHKDRGVGSYTRLIKEALQSADTNHKFLWFRRGQSVPSAADIVHYPYFDPFFLTLPWRKRIPTVVTVHDLIPIAYAEHFPPGFRGKCKWQLQKMALNGVDMVITDSEASRKDISRYTAIPREQISVVYLAPSAVFRPIKNEAVLRDIQKRLHLPERFILYVGDINWNKNIPGVLQSFAEYKNMEQDDTHKPKIPVRLVLAGKAFNNEQLAEVQHIHKCIRKFGIEEDVLFTGKVSEMDLVGLYSLATCYIQLSFAEGFGLPVLEAFACGCPVVVSRTSSLPEIAGPALQVDPYSPHDAALALRRIIRDEGVRVGKSGREWAATFTWERVAKETLHVYEQVGHN